MSMPSDEFKAFVSAMRSAIFADQCGAHMLPDQRDQLMAAAEERLISWAARRNADIVSLRFAIYGDHG